MKETRREIEVIVVGAGAGWGGRILHTLQEFPALRLSGSCWKTPAIPFSEGTREKSMASETGVLLADRLEKEPGEVIINFSSPGASHGNPGDSTPNGVGRRSGHDGPEP